MGNKAFIKIFEQEVDLLEREYFDTSREIFWKEEEKSFVHPGEFGKYREELLIRYLSNFIPEYYKISDGFIINPEDEISSQCDIVIYDKENAPIIRTSEHQRFFPSESVVAVGEVKSVLSWTEFKKALRKLAKTKAMRNCLNNEGVDTISGGKVLEFDASKNVIHNMVTFLVCEKLNFNLAKVADESDTIYNDYDDVLRHNLVLSIKDGLFLYKHSKDETPIAYPCVNRDKRFPNILIKRREEDKYSHHVLFAQHLMSSVKSVNSPVLNLFKYLLVGRGLRFLEEEE